MKPVYTFQAYAFGLASWKKTRQDTKNCIVLEDKTHHSYVLPYFEEQRSYFANRVGIDKDTIIEPKAGPQVIHQDRKAGHNSCDSQWTAELITR
jgi:hypothetical protein